MLRKILIVDDEKYARMTLVDVLEELGYKVAEASSGEEALSKARTEMPFLVLLDTNLPDINGFEVCRQIKRLKGDKVSIIIYTAYTDALDIDRAKSAGAVGCVLKTSSFDVLLEAVKNLHDRLKRSKKKKR